MNDVKTINKSSFKTSNKNLIENLKNSKNLNIQNISNSKSIVKSKNPRFYSSTKVPDTLDFPIASNQLNQSGSNQTKLSSNIPASKTIYSKPINEKDSPRKYINKLEKNTSSKPKISSTNVMNYTELKKIYKIRKKSDNETIQSNGDNNKFLLGKMHKNNGNLRNHHLIKNNSQQNISNLSNLQNNEITVMTITNKTEKEYRKFSIIDIPKDDTIINADYVNLKKLKRKQELLNKVNKLKSKKLGSLLILLNNQ